MLSLPALAQPSGPGSALSFDGSSGSYVSIATTGSLTGTFTVEMWANPNYGTGNNVTVTSRFAPQGEYSFDFGLRNESTAYEKIHGDIGNGSNWITINADANFPYATGTWYHLAYVVTPTSYSIFGNGVLVGFGGVGEGDAVLYDSAHGLGLGGSTYCCQWWNGLIDEVRIWSTDRSAQDIQANMYRTLTGTEAGLMGYWRFDEGSGTTTTDASGHGFTGTLTNGVTWVTSTAPISNAPVVVVPMLESSTGDGVVLLWWPTNASGFVLETSTSLGANQTWNAFPGPVQIFGDQNVVAANTDNRSQFFRLRKP